MTHVTCRLTAKNRDQFRNSTLGNRVLVAFTFLQFRRLTYFGHVTRMPYILLHYRLRNDTCFIDAARILYRTEQGLRNERMSVRLSVRLSRRSTAAATFSALRLIGYQSNQSISAVCRSLGAGSRYRSMQSSGCSQRQCCDPRSIDADIVISISLCRQCVHAFTDAARIVYGTASI